MWTGIIIRIINDVDSELYDIKLSAINYYNAMLEGLNDKVTSFLASNLQINVLFNIMMRLTKKLYI